GIRDRNVTGVQTCALPICALPSRSRGPRSPAEGRREGAEDPSRGGGGGRQRRGCPCRAGPRRRSEPEERGEWSGRGDLDADERRSEERRVGKECGDGGGGG